MNEKYYTLVIETNEMYEMEDVVHLIHSTSDNLIKVLEIHPDNLVATDYEMEQRDPEEGA